MEKTSINYWHNRNFHKETTPVRIFIFVLLSLVLYIPWAHSEISLGFGLYATDKPTVIVKKFRPISNYLKAALQEKLGEPIHIKFQVASSYEKGIDDLASGKVDFSRFGPASYVEVKELDPKIRILAIESKNGSKRFKGIICVHSESQLKNIPDLKGKGFAFGDEHSTIGRYLSQQYLVEHGIRGADLGRYDYLGRHDKVGHAVGLGQYDAGALKESTFNKLLKQGVPIKALADFPNVTKPWLASSTLDERIYVALQESLLELKDRKILKSLGMDDFVVGDDNDYAIIRKAILENDNFFKAP